MHDGSVAFTQEENVIKLGYHCGWGFFLLLGVVHLLGQLSILLHFFKLSKDSVHVTLEMFYTHTFIWCKLTPLKQSKQQSC